MKRLIVIFIVVVSLIGCKTTKSINNSTLTKNNATVQTERVNERTDSSTYKQNAISTAYDVSDETATKITEITRSFAPSGAVNTETVKTTEITKNAANKTKISDKGFVKTKATSDNQKDAKTDSVAQAKTVTASTEYSDNQKTGTNLRVIVVCITVLVVGAVSLTLWIKSWK